MVTSTCNICDCACRIKKVRQPYTDQGVLDFAARIRSNPMPRAPQQTLTFDFDELPDACERITISAKTNMGTTCNDCEMGCDVSFCLEPQAPPEFNRDTIKIALETSGCASGCYTTEGNSTILVRPLGHNPIEFSCNIPGLLSVTTPGPQSVTPIVRPQAGYAGAIGADGYHVTATASLPPSGIFYSGHCSDCLVLRSRGILEVELVDPIVAGSILVYNTVADDHGLTGELAILAPSALSAQGSTWRAFPGARIIKGKGLMATIALM